MVEAALANAAAIKTGFVMSTEPVPTQVAAPEQQPAARMVAALSEIEALIGRSGGLSVPAGRFAIMLPGKK